MSADISGSKCALCGAYLFEDDDVVHCPVCGAPHHRECYLRSNECAYSSLHGTDRQYDKVKQQQAEEKARQEEKQKAEAEFKDKNTASNNTNPNFTGTPFTAFTPFDPLGGIPEDFDLGKGVTAKEAKDFVLSNTHRYIPKFAANKYGKKASFNLFALLFPCSWFLSRKMYKLGAFIGALAIAFSLLTIPFALEIEPLLSGTQGGMPLLNILPQELAGLNKLSLIVFLVASLLNLALNVLSAVFGDYIYRNHTLKSVSRIKSDSADIAEDTRKAGGISFIAMIIGFFAVQYLPAIIFGFTR